MPTYHPPKWAEISKFHILCLVGEKVGEREREILDSFQPYGFGMVETCKVIKSVASTLLSN